jgi:histidyl-tRNA synthetase
MNVPDLAGSLSGGGRYDGLVGSFAGADIPACGGSLGLERILHVMTERNAWPAALGGQDAIVAAAEGAELSVALALATRLRAGDLSVDLWPDALSPGKLRKQAEARGFAAAAWVEPGRGERASVWTGADGKVHEDRSFEDAAALVRAAGARAGG